MMTNPINNFTRIAIALGLFFGCLFLSISKVSANTFAEVTSGYGYTPVVNGTAGSRTWVSYNSSNLVNYGYNLGDTNYYEIDEFNIRFRATGGFQRGTSYAITFTWDNYHPTIDTNNFYADWLFMTHTLYCYSSSWSSTGQSGSNCFTSSNISASQSGNNSIIVTITLVPSSDIYGIALVNQHGSTITYYKSIGWEIHDIGYSYSTDGSQDIINNANQNTQNIINNQDSNTQDIIDNQNQNSQDIQDSINENFNKCRNSYNLSPVKTVSLNKDSNRTFAYDLSTTLSSGNYTISYDYFSSNNPHVYVQLILVGGSGHPNVTLSNTGVTTFTATKSFNRLYFFITTDSPSGSEVTLDNIMFVTGSSSKPYETYGQQVCVNRLDEQNNSINNINDSINNSDVSGANSSADSFFNNFTTETYGLTSVITAPLTFIQSLTSKTCSPLTLPLPYVNQNLQLPCMTSIYQEHFGSFLSLYQTITFGIVSYWVIVRIFNLVKDFKNPDHDEIEVMDL